MIADVIAAVASHRPGDGRCGPVMAVSRDEARRPGLRPPTRQADHRPLPAAAVGAAAAAAPGAVARRATSARTASRSAREQLGLTDGRGHRGRDLLHACTSAARPASTTSASAPTRCARSWAATQILDALEEHLGVGNDETTAGRQGHPRAHRVQRGLRLRAGGDGQLGVLRQPDARVGHAASSTTCAPATRSTPTRGAATAVHLQGDRPGCSPASRRRPGAGEGPAGGRPTPTLAGHRSSAASTTARRERAQAGPTRQPPATEHATAERVTCTADPRARAAFWDAARVLDPGRLPSAHDGYAGAAQGAGHGRPTTSSRRSRTPACAAAAAPASRPGMKWGFIPQGDGKPHYLVVNADESEPGTCKDIPLMMANPHVPHRGRDHRLLRDPAPRTPSSTSAARWCTCCGGCGTRSPRPTRPGYLGTNILGSGFDLDLIVHAGAGAYICGEETALLDSLEGRRGQPRLRPPFPAVAGLYACPTVVNNVESIASVPSIVRQRRGLVRRRWAPRSPPGFTLFSLSGHVTAPGPVRGAAGHHAARAARPGRRDAGRPPAEVLDPGRLVDADADRRAPRRAAGLRGGRRRRVDARHQGAADLRRDHLRGPRGAALDRVLRARVVRQVHAVPRGHLLAGPDLRPARGRARAPRPTSTSCSTSATTSSAARSARSATARPARSRPRIKYFRDEYMPHLDRRRLPVRPGGRPTALRGSRAPDDRHRHPDRRVSRRGRPGHRRPSTAFEVSVPKGTLVIRAAELLGIQIPRFCDHPLLDPVGACRQCLVEVEGQRKPLASCTTQPCTRRAWWSTPSSPRAVADKAQRGRDGAAADQPPAGLPDVRQGRRVPAAEPGDVQRPQRAGSPRPSARSRFLRLLA